MKVLYVTPRYYPHIGGVEYVVKSIAERLAKMGHQVTVLAGESSIEKPIEEEINKVHIIRWPTWAPNNAYHIPKNKNQLSQLLTELAKINDIVHIHSAHAVLPVYAGLKIKQLNSSLKLIFTLHYHGTGHTSIRKLLWNTFWRNKVSQLIKEANKIHAVSHYEAELIQKHYPHAKQKIVIVPNGVEEDVFQYKWKGQNSDYMMYSGRIEKYKNLEQAVHLAQKLGLKLLILGEGSYKSSLQKYAKKYAAEKVEFKSPQPRQIYLELLASVRYAVNPSTKEAFSIFIAEALALGTPCIVSKTITEALNLNCAQQLTRELYFVDPKSSIEILTWSIAVKKIIIKLYV